MKNRRRPRGPVILSRKKYDELQRQLKDYREAFSKVLMESLRQSRTRT